MVSFTKRQVFILLGVILLAVSGWLGWQHYSNTEAKLWQAVTLTEQQAEDAKELQRQLKISQGNAAAL